MKYWRGYLAAAIFAAITLAVTQFAKSHTVLMDMVYPYTTRLIQTTLAEWSAGVDFCLWQLLAVLLVVAVLASIVIMVILRWNVVQWLGWVLAGASLLWMLHTGVYGLNNYAGPLAEDIRLNVTEYTVTELVEATTYFRDQANALAEKVDRKENGSVDYPAFEELAQMAGEGFKTLTYDRSYSVFAGSTEPVKKLGWADMYSSMSITGLTMPLTGEAAVNPHIPAVSMPFMMCHEMAHRMCISQERDANLAGFLATTAHSDPAFQYSGYFMAFRYCYSALLSVHTSTADHAARTLYAGMNSQMQKDMQDYDLYLAEYREESAANFASSVNNAYIQASGDEKGVVSYGEVCDLLVSWHIQEVYLPAHKDEEVGFDPTDKNQVQLGDNTHGN